jgi:hypothetical protein
LRQEFEKMRVLYEQRINECVDTANNDGIYMWSFRTPANDFVDLPQHYNPTPAALARRAANAAVGNMDRPWNSNKLNPVKNLNQALAKIR